MAGWKLSEPLGYQGGSLCSSSGIEKKSCSEALHTDDLALTAGSVLRQLFIKLLKEHNQVICVAFCFRLFFFSLYSGFRRREGRNGIHVNE